MAASRNALAAAVTASGPEASANSSPRSSAGSLARIDADGSPLGVCRKSQIPDGQGYQEKYYFRPGDTGFRGAGAITVAY